MSEKSFASKSVPPTGPPLGCAAARPVALSPAAPAVAAGASVGDCASASAGLLMLSTAQTGGEACLARVPGAEHCFIALANVMATVP